MLFEDLHALIMRYVVADGIDANSIDEEVFHERSIKFALFRYRERVIISVLEVASIAHAYTLKSVGGSSTFRAADLTSDEELISCGIEEFRPSRSNGKKGLRPAQVGDQRPYQNRPWSREGMSR